jgi:transcription initiation factor IIE alpha subunit
MKSRILSQSPSYSKFENILREVIQTQLKEELQKTRDELKKIIKEDQENNKNLCLQQNQTLTFSDFRKLIL